LSRGEPYSPGSRLFLNPLYIDLDAVSEFAGLKTAEMEETIDRSRRQDLFDYLGVRTVKWHALVKAYKTFCTSSTPGRRNDLECFRERVDAAGRNRRSASQQCAVLASRNVRAPRRRLQLNNGSIQKCSKVTR
jgi:4-alpha-glucanotransferase